MNDCKYLAICTGCHFPDQSYQQQTVSKINNLSQLLTEAQIPFPEIKFKTIGENGLRTRLDLTFENGKFGLYDKDKNIVDIDSCLQISKDLQKALSDLRKVAFPIRKGSVRLRVGPESEAQRAIWLDFANIDIKNLLNEKKSFQMLLDLNFHVEIGQKGKALVLIGNDFKLGEPQPKAWFQTKLSSSNNNYVSLKCLVSSFTQPSWISAAVLTDLIFNWSSNDGTSLHIAEFGAGIGQFTLPLLAYGHHVDVFESHQQAAGFLIENAKTHGLNQNLKVYVGDYHQQKIMTSKTYSLAVVNPSRSGLKDFVYELIRIETPRCIYISCYPESLVNDLKILAAYGWEIKDAVIVDQFPQTKHFETCLLLERINP